MAIKCEIIKAIQILFWLYLTVAAIATPAAKLQQPITEKQQQNVKNLAKKTDMQMTSNEYSPITIIRSQEHQYIPTQQQDDVYSTTPQPQILERSDHQYYNTPRFLTPNHEYREPAPYIHPQNIRTHPGERNRADYQRSYDAAPAVGSGDFGVLRGGTFYPKEEMPYHNDEYSDYTDYYGETSTGQRRPEAAEFIQKYTYPEEQFEHFRDFADLNMEGIDGDFSQLSTVYATKNSTKSIERSHPRNIFEQLELIDREKAEAAEKKKAIVSKSKRKLAATKLEKTYKKHVDVKQLENEPLLALS